MLEKSLIKYIFVGTYNTLLGYTLYLIFLFLFNNYSIAYFLAYLLVSVQSYFIYKKYVFSNKSKESKYTMFLIGYLIQYLIGTLLLILFVDRLLIEEYLAGFLIIPFTFIFSYFYNKYIFIK